MSVHPQAALHTASSGLEDGVLEAATHPGGTTRLRAQVAWEALMAECLWKFRVKGFGPLTVGIDAHGNSLYHDVQDRARRRLEQLNARLLSA